MNTNKSKDTLVVDFNIYGSDGLAESPKCELCNDTGAMQILSIHDERLFVPCTNCSTYQVMLIEIMMERSTELDMQRAMELTNERSNIFQPQL